MSTHAPSFKIIYFVPKLLQPTFKAIPRTPCIRLTPYDRVKLFFAPGLSPSIRTNPTRRFTFRLFTYPDWVINITFRPCIGKKSPLATEPPFFFLQQKTLGLSVAMAGSKRPNEGPSNAPIHLSSFYLPRLGHKYHLPSLYRQQVSISYRASSLLSSEKTLGLP